jgi:hypothetical protein
MIRHKTETRIAPSAWASYLINGDYSGLAHVEIKDCDSWIAAMGYGFPVSCEEFGFAARHDATPFMTYPVGADCQTYVFIVPEATD